MSEDKKMTMQDYISRAIETAKEYLEYKNDDTEDLLHEIVDSTVPLYTHDQMELVNNDYGLLFEEPEILAFDGTPTPINTIVGNIFQEISEGLYEWWDEEGEKLQEFINEGCPECGGEFSEIKIDEDKYFCGISNCFIFDSNGNRDRTDAEIEEDSRDA